MVLRKVFHTLVDVQEVEEILSKHYSIKPIGVEEVDLMNAVNRVLAEDIYAPIDYPPFDRSTVDGYAVRSMDLEDADELNPVKLVVKGVVEPGVKPSISIGRGEAVEISTGSMVPRGADSIVMVEYVDKRGEEILVYRSTVPGENISTAGSDISSGDLVVSRGTLLRSSFIGFLAGLGIEKVKVYVKPRIAVYSIGNEVVKPGEILVDGKVYDVNGYLITSILNDLGAYAVYKGILSDDEDQVYGALREALPNYDIVITSGGTSAGVGDIVYRVFDKLGSPGILIHGLKIKPGKPTVFAVVDGKLLIGLPGFPLSCFMVFNKIVKPMIMKIIGYASYRVEKVSAKIPFKIIKELGKTWFLPVALIKGIDGYTAYPVSFSSGSILSLILSDGYLVLPSNRDLFHEDEVLEVELFRKVEDIPDLNIIGSNDYLLYRIIQGRNLVDKARVLSIGSTGGWMAIKRGEADIAPTHLLDEETLTYNAPFLDRYGVRDKAVLIRGYARLIGIIVEKNNPKNIKGVEDFLREDIHIVNRTAGSGTRVYLDYLLRKLAMERGLAFHDLVKRINGYYYEVKTHTAVAVAIKQGRADAGLGLGVVAKIYGLDFIPLTWEEYDFLINRDRMEKETVKLFIESLRDRDFMNSLLREYEGYYRLFSDTGFTCV